MDFNKIFQTLGWIDKSNIYNAILRIVIILILPLNFRTFIVMVLIVLLWSGRKLTTEKDTKSFEDNVEKKIKDVYTDKSMGKRRKIKKSTR